jgi:hypothetical protein
VRSNQLRRLASIATAASLGLLLLGTGTASASVAPFEFINTESLPATVTPGADAGYQFTIHNKSTSMNISQLYLKAASNGVPTFFWNSRGTVCQQSPSLSCAFGALNAGASIDVIVAYSTVGATSPFSATFKLDSTGVAGGDAQHSHGDSVTKILSTALSADKDFVGAFELDPTTLTTGTDLGKKNRQYSSVTPPSGLAFGDYQPVTLQENVPPPTDDPCATANCIGDWSFVRVGDGTVGPVHLTILLYGPSVSGQATTTNIVLYHEGSTPNPIQLRCSDSSSIPNGGSAECITVTKQGNNFLIDAWLLHNGGYRGGYS